MKRVTITIDGEQTKGIVIGTIAANHTAAEWLLTASVSAKSAKVRFDPEEAVAETSSLVMIAPTRTEKYLYLVPDEQVQPVTTIVRKYGLLSPLDWDCPDYPAGDAFEHLFLQNKLWNDLVTIEREHRAKYRELIGSDEETAQMDTEIASIKDRLSVLDEGRKKLRVEHRKKKCPEIDCLDENIKKLKSELKAVASKAKETRAAAKDRIRAAGNDIENLEKDRQAAVIKAYNNSGLWWGNYNAVLESYKKARIKALKDGAELKYHRFDGSGRFTNQIQGGMSVQDLLEGNRNVASLRLVSSGELGDISGKKPPSLDLQSVGSRRDSREYGILAITLYTGTDEQSKKFRRTLSFPVILHRPLPEGATLKSLSVHRKRVGTDFVWSVVFTFTTDCPTYDQRSSTGNRCGLNLGWKKQAGGGLRVATIYDGSDARHITLPQAIIDGLDYVNGDLQGRIDSAANENHAWLLEQWGGDELPESLQELRSMLRRSKRPHPAKFAKAVIAWRNYPEYLGDARDEAEQRRKATKRLTIEMAHKREKLLRRRMDFYRNTAKQLTSVYDVICLDKMDLRRLALLEKGDGTPNELTKIARKQRQQAAISELRECLSKAAAKNGTQIEQVSTASSATCSACKGKMEQVDGIMWRCRECRALVDQDINAAANLFREVL
ncbi:zinc ribbon domain-containing protein [Pelobacter propionicus]|uniref:CRISPR-associated DNA-binding protein Cas12m n=1 Tax=Pelobacter propionicus (strain DSM 2379 / NBRC 103807 / OttBd1) TaxID=338966 RepID=CS12M_PELPD|nr:zinc ribbon domain-containing protein [Pelobacter propionicus]ABL01400.1 transposase, IS605 OrfB [Pelobacter propionicus DSM 2379]